MRLTVFRLIASVVMVLLPVAGHAYEAEDRYSTPEQREVWQRQLSEESSSTPTLYFHPLGHLTGLSGSFVIGSSSSDAVREWLLRHAAMFGIGPREGLAVVSSAPFFEVRQTGETTYDDVEAGTTFRFVVTYGESRFAGRDLVAIVRSDTPVVRGVFNGHVPAVSGYGQYVAIAESVAWSLAETNAGGSLARLDATQAWFDLTWATTELPGQKDMFWLLKGETSDGKVRTFAVRNRDQSVQIATSGLDSFSVNQDHRGYLQAYSPSRPDSRLYWTNVIPDPTTVCSSLSSDCTDPAYSDSLASRASWPEIVDIWHERSQPGGNPPLQWQWPWTGLHKSPFTNRNRSLLVVLGHTGQDCYPYPTPCSTSTKYWFGPSDSNDGIYGHEYGHRIISELKSTEGGNSAAGKVTEAMCDLFGVLSEDYRLQRLYPCSVSTCSGPTPRTDFRIEAPSSNQVVDLKIPTSSCTVGIRATLGYAFYDAYTRTSNFTINVTRDPAFNAWQIAILRAYEAAPVWFPVMNDFYAASVSQLPPQPHPVFPSPGPVVNLQQSLFATGCFP